MAGTKQGDTRTSRSRDYSPLLVFIGVGTCLASLLSLLVFSSVPLSPDQVLVEKELIVLAMILSFLLFYFLAGRFSSLRGELASCTFGCIGAIAFALEAFIPTLPFALHVAFGCVAGAGIAALITVWFVDLCLRPRNQPFSHVAGAFCIGLGLVLGMSLFSADVRNVAALISWCASSALSLVQWRQHSNAGVPPAIFDPKTIDSRSRIKIESYIMMAALDAQIGFLIGMGQVESDVIIPIALAAAVMAGLAFTIDAAMKVPRISERSLFSITTPITVAAFACLYLFGDVTHVVATCVIAMFCMVYQVMGTVALCKHIILERLSPVRSYARSRAINFTALAIGIALGFTAGRLFAEDALWGIQLTVVLALVYSFIASFFHRPRFPDSTLKSDGIPAASTAKDKGLFLERCYEASERYGLSERQFEVLCLIAQGRNAEYVANALTISVSTVQTHIRNIYQKLGVHSRQELIDMIEDVKLYGED